MGCAARVRAAQRWRLSGERRPCCWTAALSRRALDDLHDGLDSRDGFGRRRDDRGRTSRAGRRPRPGRGRRYRRRRDLAGVRHSALRRVGIDLEHEVEADALAGLQARDREAALAADATQPPVGAHEGHLTRDSIAGPEVAGGETAAVADRDPVARAATGGRRRAVSRLLDRHVARWWTRAVLRSDTHVVEQVATTEEGKGPRHAGAELQAVNGRGRIAVRRWCLLRSGAIVVLPRREALTDVTTVDGDSHQVVVNALVDLDPEPDRVWNRTVLEQRKVVIHELAIDLRGIGCGDPDAVLGVFQAHPGHARSLAGVRADAHEQSALVGGRLGHKRELGHEHLIEPRLADL